MTVPMMSSGQPGGNAEVLRRHGRSFYWAGQLLSGAHLSQAASLYSLCRGIDDLADEALTPAQKSSADQKLSNLDRALAGLCRPDDDLHSIYTQGYQLLAHEPLALEALRDLIGTVQKDLKPVRISDHGELLHYAYGVAGTVGVMMTCLLEAHDRRSALPHAMDLGIAMQFTNMARDVLEDAGLGRIYLPASGAAGEIEPADLMAGRPQARHRAWQGVCELIGRAEAYYNSGWQGLAYLPLRPRLAIAVAGRVYREIGQQILQRGEAAYWQRRSVVNSGRKLLVSVKALTQLTVESRGGRRVAHDSRLHRNLLTCLDARQERV